MYININHTNQFARYIFSRLQKVTDYLVERLPYPSEFLAFLVGWGVKGFAFRMTNMARSKSGIHQLRLVVEIPLFTMGFIPFRWLVLGFLKDSTVGRSFFTKKILGGKSKKVTTLHSSKLCNPKLYQTHFWRHLRFGPFWLTLKANPPVSALDFAKMKSFLPKKDRSRVDLHNLPS